MIVEKLLGKTDRGELLRHLEERMGKPKAELAPFLAKVLEETKDSPIEKLTLLSKVDEYQILKENSAYLQRLLGAEVKVFREDDPEIYDPKGRSKGALPFRPAIYVE